MTYPDGLPTPERIDPQRLTALLEQAGWQRVGGRRGIYDRLAPPHASDESGLRGGLVVPLDRSAPDYAHLMSAVIMTVSAPETREVWRRVIEPRLVAASSDQFQFRREIASASGLIPWRQGEDLVRAARSTLAAGAKSYVEKMRRYSNKLGQFSNRFLDSILMGQTAVGSYIVTAYAPTDVVIPISGAALPGGPEARDPKGRDVTLAVATALEATAEALEHLRHTRSMAAFDDGIGRGVSYELSTALEEFSRGSDGGDISINWEEGADLIARRSPSRFVFTPMDAALLGRAATHLAREFEPVSRRTVIGRVHLLTKKELGAPGVFGLAGLSGQARRFRVRLRDEADYHWAVKAHDEDLILAVEGELERDGNIFWLYQADIKTEVTTVEEVRDKIGHMPPLVEQLVLDPESGA